MNTYTKDDPRLTAYILGELDPEEALELQKELDANPDLAAYVDELAESADAFETALAAEPMPALTDEQRDSILIKGANPPKKKPAPRRPWKMLIHAAAACLILGLIAWPVIEVFHVELPEKPIPTIEVGIVEIKKPKKSNTGTSQQLSEPTTVAEDLDEVRPLASPSTLDETLKEVMEESETMYVADPASIHGKAGKGLSSASPIPESSTVGGLTEGYSPIVENSFKAVKDHPLSTFSIDVDTASYANMRRFLNRNQLPPADAVRIEEMVNYFNYDYPQPDGEQPFSVNMELAACPWTYGHQLLRVGLKGREISNEDRPPVNLVFLLDVSGSMSSGVKLPLVKEAMKLLVPRLREDDRVAMVVYAGASGLVLESTPGDDKQTIISALDRLNAGGSTNGGAGIDLAYKTAMANKIDGGVNRVILCTDGDFNVGTTDRGGLIRMVEERAKKGVYLTVFGFGMGNLKDNTLEQLANKGNGVYGYIDNQAEARKWLVDGLTGTLVTIAKDVKIQIEFNPAHVASYRLVGYENRMLAKEDFNDDTKDAGEIGAGHTVTALYELVPPNAETGVGTPKVDALKYRPQPKPAATPATGEMLTLKLRYKDPDVEDAKSTRIEYPLENESKPYAKASGDYKFAASVAAFGMILRDSEYRGTTSIDAVLELAEEGIGEDTHGHRREFIQLVKKAKQLKK